MIHALGLAAVPLGRLFNRSRGLRWAAVALLALHLMTPPTWPLLEPGTSPRWGLASSQLTLSNAVIRVPLSLSDLGRELSSPAGLLTQLVVLVEGLAAVGVAAAWGRAVQRPSRGRAALAALATAALFAVPLGIGSAPPASSPCPGSPYRRAWQYLDLATGPRGARVAYAGTNMPYYLMGRDLRNDVVYVNIDAHRGWLLHDYHREAIAQGQPNWP